MKFVVFGFNLYYPEGGINDLLTIKDSLDDTKSFVEDHLTTDESKSYYQVCEVDNDKIAIVDEFQDEWVLLPHDGTPYHGQGYESISKVWKSHLPAPDKGWYWD